MARFEDLRANILQLDPVERQAIFEQYLAKREVEVTLPPAPTRTRKASASGKAKNTRKIPVSTEQLKLLKKLGLI